MIDHVSIAVADIDAAGQFYDAVLATLGYERIVEHDGTIGYSADTRDSAFFLARDADARPPSSGAHIAFDAPDRSAVDEFHRTAVNAGAEDDGEPGPRAYSEHYYAAYIVDPHGYRVEAVTHQPE